MIVILGGGISGISAGYHLRLKGIESTVYEKNVSWGGLCDNFEIGKGFRFDTFVHLSFTKDDYVNQLFAKSTDHIKHNPISSNYYKGSWLKHPVQNNLSPLSTTEKINIIADFVTKPVDVNPKNYHEWLLAQFGSYFTNEFPLPYTLKYWTLPAKKLSTDWLGSRFSLPNIEQVLKGAFEEQEQNYYYASEMRYPKSGGYKEFLRYMADNCEIKTATKASLIDLKAKNVFFEDGTEQKFEQLVSSIPLPELIKIIKDVPSNITEAANKLTATSGQLVSMGFNNPEIAKYLWFYIYDKNILPARAYSPSLKSPDNVPVGKSSLQFETYFSRFNPKKLSDGSLIEHIVKKGEKMSLWSKNDIEITDYREVKYANVVFDFERKKNLTIVHRYLKENNISYIGRFGEWDYLWSDQSLLSGKKIADNV